MAAAPLRRRVLEELDQPDSATGVARRLGLSRQKVNYHLRKLERDGLVELVDERRRRGFVERRLRAVARDRFSSAYLATAAERVAADVTTLRARARAAGQPLATVAVETEIRFASPAELHAFADELAAATARLAATYDRPDLPAARRFRVLAGAYPTIMKEPPDES
jgi:DNA-binding transcriptional ArsR family regulator